MSEWKDDYQHIVFEGCDCIVIAPEDMEAKDKRLELAGKLVSKVPKMVFNAYIDGHHNGYTEGGNTNFHKSNTYAALKAFESGGE